MNWSLPRLFCCAFSCDFSPLPQSSKMPGNTFVLKKSRIMTSPENLGGTVFGIMEVKLVADVAEESWWDGPGIHIFTEAMNSKSATLRTLRWRWSRRTRPGSRQTRTAPTWSSGRRSSAACPRSQNSGTQPESWVIGLEKFFRSQFLGLFYTFINQKYFCSYWKELDWCQWWGIAFVL